jgi:iron complex outermembrane recepter protein
MITAVRFLHRPRRPPVRRGRVIGVTLLAGLMFAFPLGGQEARAGSLDGLVRADGRAVRGALVRIGDGAGVLTDGSGRFHVREVPSGAVVVRVEAVGYRPEERTVSSRERGSLVVIELVPDPMQVSGVVATATPLRGGVRYQPARALDREALQRRAAASVGQMLDGEPGVAMRSFGAAPARPVIRGLDGDRIAVLENGQRMGDISETAPDHSVALEPLTADRVEVVRGPASLLYGSSALGGVVNLLREDIPRSWVPGLEGSLAVQAATVNREGAVAGRGVLGGEVWAGAARFALRDGKDFRAPGSSGGLLVGTHSRRVSAGVGAGYRAPGARAGLALDVLTHDFGIPEETDGPGEQVEIQSGRQRLSGELDWGADGFWDRFELRVAATRFVQREVERASGSDGAMVMDVAHEFTRHTVGAALTAGHGGVGPVGEGAVGISVLGQTLAATGAEEFHPDARALSAAAFLFEELPFRETLRLQAGARIEAQQMRALPNATFPDIRDSRTRYTVSGSLGANVRPVAGMELGAQLARAHRAPLVEELYSEGPHLGTGRYEIGSRDLPNEIGYGADVFARYASDGVAIEVTGFINRIRDFVILRATGAVDPASSFPIYVYEADAAELVGGEVSMEVRPVATVTLRGTTDWVRGSRRDADRTPLPYVPPARSMLEGEYDTGRWWLGARTRMAAAQRRVADEAPTDGYALLDLQAGFRPPGAAGHTLVLRADNVLDTAYRDHLSRVEGRRFPMPGRNVTVSYRWRF